VGRRKQSEEAQDVKASPLRAIGAAVAGLIAVKLATVVVTATWRLATREDPPQADEAAPLAKKAAWIALVAAATGAARQVARDYVNPPPEEPV
jgi:hypothetical protein